MKKIVMVFLVTTLAVSVLAIVWGQETAGPITAGPLPTATPDIIIDGEDGPPAPEAPFIPHESHLGPGSIDIEPASTTSVANCIPFGNNTFFGFTGFIYRNVPAFNLQVGGKFAFDLGQQNAQDIRRNIYFAAASQNPAPAPFQSNVTSQGITALGWTKVASDTQTPQNPRGNFVQGDYELVYTAEAPFSFPGGGFIVGFGGSPPGEYADVNCEQVLVRTDGGDASGFFYARFCFMPDQTLGVLDAGPCGGTGTHLGGILIQNSPPLIGMVADAATGSVIVFDALGDTVLGVVPIGLGSVGDCSITADRTLGFATRFNGTVRVIDLTTSPPSLAAGINSIPISNPGEDTSISPDQQYVVVSDGGANQPISVIDIATRTQISTFSLGHDANSVEVLSDGSVLVTSSSTGSVRRLTNDGAGNLTDTGEVLSSIGEPNNVFGAPSATSGIVITRLSDQIKSFTIPGLALVDTRNLSGSFGISGLVNPAGNRVYARDNSGFVDVFSYNSVTGALSAAPLFSIPISGTTTFFGMDQMALTPDGTKLYVSQSGALNVYNANTGAFITSITHPSISLPTGVCFASQPLVAHLTVIKNVVNDHGGTAVPSDWTMDIIGTNHSSTGFPGQSTGVTVTLAGGAYSITESGGPSDYTASFSADCSGTIALGESKICTITNDDVQPSLSIIKTVINDHGGTALPGNWNMDITGTDISSTGFPGQGDPGVKIGLDAGAYSLTESGGPFGYAASFSAGCSGTIAIGETKTCTITNDDIQPSLTVIKDVINDDGGTATASDWTMDVTGTNVSSTGFPGQEAPGVKVTLDAGAYSIDESGGVANYKKSLSAGCAGTIGVGETKTCTITNDDNVPLLGKGLILRNVWLTRQGTKIPPPDCLSGDDIASLAEALDHPIASPDPKDPSQSQQLAAFEFEMHYDATKVCVAVTEGAAWTAAGASCIVEDSDSKPQLEGVARIGCVTTGKGHNINELDPLALIDIYPQPEIYSQANPNQDNGVVIQVHNVNCDLGDEQGHAIPISGCHDVAVTFRYLEGDVNPDCVVDAADAQTIAFRWGVQKGSLIYSDFLNLEPSGAQADDDIDINDLQFVFGRIGSTCDDPHPPQEPVNPLS